MTPLEALERIKQKYYFVDFELDTTVGKDCKKELDIIETALKDNQETIDKLSNDIKHLKATNRRNDKKLKALKVIREKRVFVEELLESDDLEEYNYWVDEQGRYDEDKLIQKEYELLKEVLL